MKQTTKRRLVACVALLLALSIVLGLATAAFAAEPERRTFDLTDADGDGKFNYVSIGASNTNGYGIRGYVDDAVIEGVVNGTIDKADINVYGYQRSPEGSYTDLIADYIAEKNPGVEVVLNQLAISSMRAEEVRTLLDNDYYGDAYTAWRFIKSDGTGRFDIAEPKGGLAALRETYQTSVKNADLITLDIGWNNFGVYVCNNVAHYLKTGQARFDNELIKILGEENRGVANLIVSSIKKEISGLVEGMEEAHIDFAAKAFAYALVGYIVNFDIVMGKIYEANPDAQVVVLGIQNLLHGVNAVDAEYGEIHVGEVYDEIVDMANVYLEKYSPYKDQYIFTMTGEGNHVTTFLDEIAKYDGNPAGLSDNMKDCFDLYEDGLMLKYALAMEFGKLYANELKALNMTAFELVAAGEAGTLTDENAKMLYAGYSDALNAAYDTGASIMHYVATKLNTVDSKAFSGDVNKAEAALEAYIVQSLLDSAYAAVEGKTYELDFTIFEDPTNALMAAIEVRFYFGNSFYAHPSEQGHVEIYNDVINAAKGVSSKTATLEMLGEALESIVEAVACENTGHYGPATWTWSEDASEATVTQTCYRCNKTGTAKASVAEKTIVATVTESTCAEAGKAIYTAKASPIDTALMDTKEIQIPAKGHDMKEVKQVAATCEKDGTKGHFQCSVCENLFADKDGKTAVKAEDLVIKAGHDLKDGICTVCGVDTNAYKAYRVFGDNRYQTGFAVADQLKETLGVEKFDTVIVASGTTFADALAGSYLAAEKDAPILLVNIHNVVNVKNYIRANLVKGGTIYLLGGESAISTSMETGLAGYTITRLAGENRYDTNLAILMAAGLAPKVETETEIKTLTAGDNETAEDVFEDDKTEDTKLEDDKTEDTKPEDDKTEDTKPEDDKTEDTKPEEETKEPVEILVCTGRKFADSLSASALGKPILLVRDTLSDHQKAYLKSLDMELEFVIIGGESAVSAKLEAELKAYGTTDRVGGENRFETSILLAERFLKDTDPKYAVLAYAKKFPDGLCGGPLAYSLKAPLILTMTGMEKEAAAYTEDTGITRGYVLGGDGLISDDAVRTIFGMEKTDKIGIK